MDTFDALAFALRRPVVGLDANCVARCVRLTGDEWANGATYLMDNEDGTVCVCICVVDDGEHTFEASDADVDDAIAQAIGV